MSTSTISSDYVNLTVAMQDSDDVQMRIRPSTKLGKIKKAFADKKGLPLSALRFFLVDKTTTDEVQDRVNRWKSFRKVKRTYAKQHALPVSALRVVVVEKILEDDDTAQSVGLKDDALIAVYQDNDEARQHVIIQKKKNGQTAQEISREIRAGKQFIIGDNERIRLRIREKGTHGFNKLRVKPLLSIGKLRKNFSDINGTPLNSLKFYFGSKLLDDDSTVRELGLLNMDVIDTSPV